MNEYDTIDELKKMLDTIKDKPSLYLGEKSITLLNAFINGFLDAFYVVNGKNKYVGFYTGFNEWVAQKYNIKTSHGWSSIIKFMEREEALAFDTFYKLLDEYLYQSDESKNV